MIDFLRDPAWQGVAGIVAVVTFALYIITERNRFLLNLSQRRTALLRLGILLLMIVAMSVLVLGSYATVLALVDSIPQPWGSLLAGSLLGGGLAGYFALASYFSLRDYVQNINNFVIRLIFITIALGAGWGGAASIGQLREPIIFTLLFWTAGAFTMGNTLIILILWDRDNN